MVFGGAKSTDVASSAEKHFEWLLEQDPLLNVNIAYDICVCLEKWPHLFSKVFAAYDDDRIVDVSLMQRLIDNADGRMKFFDNLKPSGYSQAGLSQRILKKTRTGKDEEDAWRFRYNELEAVPLAAWPEAASTYAVEDADDALAVGLHQMHKHRDLIGDAPSQSRAAFALQLMMCWGVKTDPKQIDKLEVAARELLKQLDALLAQAPPCVEHESVTCTLCAPRESLIRGPVSLVTGKKTPKGKIGTRNTRVAQLRMFETTVKQGLEHVLTDTGFKLFADRAAGVKNAAVSDFFSREELIKYTAIDAENCEESGDSTLQQYAKRIKVKSIYDTHVPDLRKGVDLPIQPRYNTFVETGRTSCTKGDDRKKKKANPKPPPTNGYQMQNPRRALTEFPTGVGIRECFMPRDGMYFADNDFSGLELHTGAQACIKLVGYSELAKALNARRDPHLQFGAKMLGISYEDALKNKHDKKIKQARQLAKPANFGLPGGLGVKGLMRFARGYGLKLSFEEAKKLRDEWFEAFPEWVDYFREIRAHIDPAEGTGRINQLYTERVRGGVTYTAACNSMFQGLGADGAKKALYEVARRCYVREMQSVLYGARPVAFIHDEILAEVFRELAHEQAIEMAKVMVDACNVYLPDVPVRCEPAVCLHWSKDVEAVYDRNGRLQPYDLARDGRWESYRDRHSEVRVDWN